MAGTSPYFKVLKDLERRRSVLAVDLERLQTECADLDGLIAGIKKLVSAEATVRVMPLMVTGPVNSSQPTTIKSMSMRWALLTIFGQASVSSMGVGEVLDALTESGFPITPKTRNNLSAVLSRMVALGEVTNSGNNYTITDRGRGALQAIQGKQVPISADSQDVGESTEGV